MIRFQCAVSRQAKPVVRVSRKRKRKRKRERKREGIEMP
jgi:hypothetical protein